MFVDVVYVGTIGTHLTQRGPIQGGRFPRCFRRSSRRSSRGCDVQGRPRTPARPLRKTRRAVLISETGRWLLTEEHIVRDMNSLCDSCWKY